MQIVLTYNASKGQVNIILEIPLSILDDPGYREVWMSGISIMDIDDQLYKKFVEIQKLEVELYGTMDYGINGPNTLRTFLHTGEFEEAGAIVASHPNVKLLNYKIDNEETMNSFGLEEVLRRDQESNEETYDMVFTNLGHYVADKMKEALENYLNPQENEEKELSL